MNTNNKPENRNEALKAILRKSHAQALAGETYSRPIQWTMSNTS